MTRDDAARRARKLLALAAVGSGASEHEARNAALAAARLIAEHGLLDAEASAIDLDQVTELALHAAELEHTLAAERVAHAQAIQARDEQWRAVVERVRREEHASARSEREAASRRAVREARTDQARAGGRERDRRLTDDRKSEIGRAGARERWRRWRERHRTEPP